jgi:hypothetical protein
LSFLCWRRGGRSALRGGHCSHARLASAALDDGLAHHSASSRHWRGDSLCSRSHSSSVRHGTHTIAHACTQSTATTHDAILASLCLCTSLLHCSACAAAAAAAVAACVAVPRAVGVWCAVAGRTLAGSAHEFGVGCEGIPPPPPCCLPSVRQVSLAVLCSAQAAGRLPRLPGAAAFLVSACVAYLRLDQVVSPALGRPDSQRACDSRRVRARLRWGKTFHMDTLQWWQRPPPLPCRALQPPHAALIWS